MTYQSNGKCRACPALHKLSARGQGRAHRPGRGLQGASGRSFGTLVVRPSRRTPLTAAGAIAAAGSEPVEAAFAEVVGLIEQARQRAYQAVNTELVGLYWEIGRYISAKLEAAVWGEGVVDRLADHLARTLPGQRGFTRRNLFRMRQFYEVYSGDEKVTPLLTQLPWTHNLIILSQSKRAQLRERYRRLEKLFNLYTKMVAKPGTTKQTKSSSAMKAAPGEAA